MRWNRIDLKLGFTLISLILLLFVPMAWIADQTLQTYSYRQEHREMNELAAHFVSMLEGGDTPNLETMRTMADFTQVQVRLLDHRNQLLAQSKDSSSLEMTFLTAKQLELLTHGIPLNDEQEIAGSNYSITGIPLLTDGKYKGAVILTNSLTPLEQTMNQVRSLMLLSALSLMIVGIVFTMFITRRLSKPLLLMSRATKDIASGKLDTLVPVSTEDEIGQLARSINEMTSSLKHYRDSRNEFIANVSHELKTPITYLDGYAQVVAEGWVESEQERQRYLNIIRAEAGRLNTIIHDLFELSKLEEGRIRFEPEPISIRSMMCTAIAKVQLEAEQKGLELQVHAGDPSWLVWGDAVRLEQIAINLLDNSIRYTPHGHIHVSVMLQEQTITLRFTDTGLGIPSEELPYIFERFYRVEKSRSREYGGSGLGLAIVSKLVALHHGTIHVDSEPGEGTTFTIELPLYTGSDPEPSS